VGGEVEGPGLIDGFMLLQENRTRPINTIGTGNCINRRRNCIFINEVWFVKGDISSTTIAPKI
jgi:hypothetical protein